MTKEQQDIAWACLPKEARKQIRNLYYHIGTGIYIQTCLESVFGEHNLTSDTEPEEMLYVKRSKVCHLYECYKPYQRTSNEVVKDILEVVFGDKCLPDKEPSVQGEPKFSKGDLVKCLNDGIIYEVERKSGLYHYHLKGKDNPVHINWLEPYTEPISQNPAENSNTGSLSSKSESMEEEDAKKIVDNTISIAKEYFDNVKIDKDNMEEKELNLAELLKGCTGEWFYVTPCGEMELKGINKLELKPLHFSMDAINCLTKTDGRAYENGSCIIYPSRALYEKYPLDAYSAWMEWKEARKPKRWRAEKGEKYWWIDFGCVVVEDQDLHDADDDMCYNSKNYFRTKEEAQQAAEAVRECLEKFHKDHTDK